MLARLLAISIVGFWITMTALLIQMETSTAKSSLREVSLAHVFKLVFTHEQPSELHITGDGMRLGYLRLHPRVDRESGARLIDFTGNLQLRLPGVARQRMSWDGAAELSPGFDAQHLRFDVTLHEPLNSRTELRVDLVKRVAVIGTGTNRVRHEEVYPLDETGLQRLMEHLEIDVGMVKALSGGAPNRPVFRAEQSSLRIRGEKIETYLVTIQQSGQTLLDMHISQLGQVLRAKTLVGYTLAPDDLMR